MQMAVTHQWHKRFSLWWTWHNRVANAGCCSIVSTIVAMQRVVTNINESGTVNCHAHTMLLSSLIYIYIYVTIHKSISVCIIWNCNLVVENHHSSLLTLTILNTRRQIYASQGAILLWPFKRCIRFIKSLFLSCSWVLPGDNRCYI